jgi:hypothetical protein
LIIKAIEPTIKMPRVASLSENKNSLRVGFSERIIISFMSFNLLPNDIISVNSWISKNLTFLLFSMLVRHFSGLQALAAF